MYKFHVESFSDLQKFEDFLNNLQETGKDLNPYFYVGTDDRGWWAVVVYKTHHKDA